MELNLKNLYNIANNKLKELENYQEKLSQCERSDKF